MMKRYIEDAFSNAVALDPKGNTEIPAAPE
jgi:hypothetical protein